MVYKNNNIMIYIIKYIYSKFSFQKVAKISRPFFHDHSVLNHSILQAILTHFKNEWINQINSREGGKSDDYRKGISKDHVMTL